MISRGDRRYRPAHRHTVLSAGRVCVVLDMSASRAVSYAYREGKRSNGSKEEEASHALSKGGRLSEAATPLVSDEANRPMPLTRTHVRVALTIAGSDSGGGAGLAADLKTFLAHRVHGAVAVTCVTAQDTVGVRAIERLPARLVRAQIVAVLDDLALEVAKTGFLAGLAAIDVIEAVADRLPPVIVDPVCVDKHDRPILDDATLEALRATLLPRAALLTPNLAEAALLAGVEVRDRAVMERAATRLLEMGATAALIKGGRLGGARSPDLLATRAGLWDWLDAPQGPHRRRAWEWGHAGRRHRRPLGLGRGSPDRRPSGQGLHRHLPGERTGDRARPGTGRSPARAPSLSAPHPLSLARHGGRQASGRREKGRHAARRWQCRSSEHGLRGRAWRRPPLPPSPCPREDRYGCGHRRSRDGVIVSGSELLAGIG